MRALPAERPSGIWQKTSESWKIVYNKGTVVEEA
jgi:hypothetical protein